MNCKFCGKTVVQRPTSHRVMVFCNSECNRRYQYQKRLRLGIYKKTYSKIKKEDDPKQKNKRKMRPCLGVYCLGKKKFRSTGIDNRQCPRCLHHNKGCLDINPQAYTPSRSSRP